MRWMDYRLRSLDEGLMKWNSAFEKILDSPVSTVTESFFSNKNEREPAGRNDSKFEESSGNEFAKAREVPPTSNDRESIYWTDAFELPSP